MMLRQIQYFQAIVQQNSFTEAAELCHISQSGISRSIQALEDEIGAKLIVRKNRSFELTEAGEHFYKKSLIITADLEQLCHETVRISRKDSAELRLGVLSSYSGDEFNRAVAAFSEKIVYQATAYLGFGRVLPFLDATNKVFEEKGIALPLEGQATTTLENRREQGTQAQVDIFGENMKNYWKYGPEESRHINYWLADNCFGDYYTRTGLDYAQREMITFCFIAAQGGCESQLTAHASANMNVGNDKKFLIKVISQCLPFIGYPRSLNALACVNKATEEKKQG